MKSNRISRVLMSTFFALMFSVAAVGCLVTGFDLPVDSNVRILVLLPLISLLPHLLLSFRHGVWLLLALSAQGGYYLWCGGELWEQMQSFAHTVTEVYSQVYEMDVIGRPITDEFDLVLILLMAWTALAVGLCVFYRQSLLWAVPPVILPLFLCLVTYETLPDQVFLYLLILGFVLLLLLDWTRKKDIAQSFSLMLRVVIPSAIAVGLLFFLNPQAEYVDRTKQWSEKISAWFELAEGKDGYTESEAEGNQTDLGTERLNLRYVGPKSNRMTPVMLVKSTEGGKLYLRGRDYDIYTGSAWRSSDERNEIFPFGRMNLTYSLEITTYGIKKVLYTPYYSTSVVPLVDGYLKNEDQITHYSYIYSPYPNNRTSNLSDNSQYTKLLPETYAWASALVSQVIRGNSTSDRAKVHNIEEFVQNSAQYDLNTESMSDDYEDFAKWFLEQSDTGYCVHFATSATVLLRAAGIPARYVEGYMIQCEANADTVITAGEAHAWVEYYDSESAVWRILEATPSLDVEEGEETVAETEAMETEAPESAESTAETDGAESLNKPEESVPPEEETEPAPPDDPTNKGDKASFRINQSVWWILLALLCLAVIPVQGEIRIALRQKRWMKGKPNEMALVRYRICIRLGKAMKKSVPKELEELALKAKYSQYTLTTDELRRFDDFREEILKEARAMKPIPRIVLRWFFAVG